MLGSEFLSIMQFVFLSRVVSFDDDKTDFIHFTHFIQRISKSTKELGHSRKNFGLQIPTTTSHQ